MLDRSNLNPGFVAYVGCAMSISCSLLSVVDIGAKMCGNGMSRFSLMRCIAFRVGSNAGKRIPGNSTSDRCTEKVSASACDRRL
jgi:hypothetical protein